MVDVTGIGSWPGTDVREALRVVAGELAGDAPEGVRAVPYLPELPARGPGADLVGRAAHLLVDLPVDLQPQGWRLVDRPGRDAERAASLLTQDLDELAEALDGYAGPLKVQVAGPWTLAASLWRPLGDRVLDDPGATRDVVASLSEGVGAYLGRVQRLVPGAELVLQVDEPSLTSVLLGRIRSESGYRVLRTPERGEVVTALRQVLDQPAAQVCGVHTCAADPPVDVLADAGAGFVAVDLAQVGRGRFEQVAAAVEDGCRLWAGLDPAAADPLEPLLRRWHESGLPVASLADVALTPACGLASASPAGARQVTRSLSQAALRLAETAVA
ncbi:methionine synthase [Serinicoccus chungangensis]|uniref:Methionine synthase n=1 Tax=Serinicoccus chungangensis TaxID=767452 RepID=A0A0W8I8W5_9MICO|nr:methionine synthase [Serinicoccus chungangensis]KUG55833.1 methionine synthase [Serinicoccus chungangensis]